MRLLSLIIVVVFQALIVSGQAVKNSPSMTVFGLELDKPLSLPECKRLPTESPDTINYAPTEETCFEYLSLKVRDEWVVNRVVFSAAETPRNFSERYLNVSVLDGYLVRAFFFTSGVISSDDNLAELKAKYGEPTSIERSVLQHPNGAKFDRFTANWIFKDLRVKYQNMARNPNEGYIDIHTSSAYDRMHNAPVQPDKRRKL